MITNADIVGRFFKAIDELVKLRKLRGVATFAKICGIDRRNLHHQRRDHTRGIFRVEWLAALVELWNVSPRWLLTGKGDIFEEGER